MTRSNIAVSLGILVWILSLTLLLWFANFGHIKPMNNTSFVQYGETCQDKNCEPVELPFHSEARFTTDFETQSFRFVLSLPEIPDELQGLYLPHFADDVFVKLNGATVFGEKLGNQAPRRLWNRPVLISISPTLLHQGDNLVEIELSGYPQEGLILESFHFGPYQSLNSDYFLRYASTAGAAQFSLGLMLVAGFLLGGIWLARREAREYLVLATSCFFACIICIQWGFDTSSLPYWEWTIFWNLAITIYVFTILKFSNYFMCVDLKLIEKIYVTIFILEVICLLLIPPEYLFRILMIFKLHPFFGSIAVVTVFFRNRQNINNLDFWIFFLCLSIASALGVFDLYFTAIEAPGRSQHLFQFMPVDMLFICLWLVMSQLMRSLSNYENLTSGLQQTIDEKTQELKTTYAKLGEAEQQKAIHNERQRIMSDLHDGIGGQLVNTLAYMQNNDAGDEVMQLALEDALRDLSLMLDSLETEASISTLLGMLRTRLETLLADNNIEFDWRIEEEPQLPAAGPSQNLNLMRIVQESITNVIKHADASTITIASDKNSVSIIDNGKGFDPRVVEENMQGYGLRGMKRRAETIGASLTLDSSHGGTKIKLTWK